MYNATTIGAGLGFLPSRLLAWGLGSWIAVEIEIIEVPRVIWHGGGGRVFKVVPEKRVIITVRFGRFEVARTYRIPDMIAQVAAKFIGKVKIRISTIKARLLWNKWNGQ